MKKLFAMLLVVVMVFGMIPVSAGAETATATPSLEQFSMTLNGILDVNCLVVANGADMDQVSLRFTIGDNVSVQEITEYTRRGDDYVFTASLPCHRAPESIKMELLVGNTVVQTKTDWTVKGYLEQVKASDPSNTTQIQLCDALWNYCAYAAWNAHDAEAMNVPEVEAVTAEDIGSNYAYTTTSTEKVYYGASLIFNDAIDIRYYFVESKMSDYTVAINDKNVAAAGTANVNGTDMVYYELERLMPQQYDDGNTVTVSNGEEVIFELNNYSAYTYIYNKLTKGSSSSKLPGLLKAMYLYSVAAEQYIDEEDGAITMIDQLLLADSWSNGGTEGTNTLTVPANSSLKADYLKNLWAEGYTHLVFTVNAEAASDNNTNYTNGGQWDRYWSSLDAAADVDIRVDLNEFHDGDTWYSLNFNAGSMTVSNPRAYKSPETLNWTKSSTNCYFALEDGYYVLETRGNDFGVTSPASWVQKYMVSDDAAQRTWLMYTDYISQRDNTRSMLWGWGSPVDTVNGSVSGGWSWNNNVSADHNAFSLHIDKSGTARFKLLEWVSNRNGWNSALALSYVDEQTIRWSAASDYKLRLATTQDLIAQGYTTLKVTLTGDLGSAQIWYGDDDWSNGEICVSADSFSDGSCTFEVDLTTFAAGKNFTMMANAASFTDLLVKIEPVKPIYYNVTAPAGEGFTFSGESSVLGGSSYSFTVAPNDGVAVTVKVNGEEITGENGTYTVENVDSVLVITVETKILTIVDKLASANSWSAGGDVSGSALIVPAISSLKADYLKALWNDGYTHLVFTVNAQAASDNNTNYTHGGSWSQYWANFDAATNVDIRIDLNEFHNGDTWYNVSFNSGAMTVSNPRAYKSAETLNWTKSSTNCYFAIEDGYYVLETRGNDFGVTSPASWVQKYMVSDDAGQRTWLMYTDYISQRDNTRSMLWGWGSAVNTVCGDVNGGWAWNNNVSADHNAFSLHMDKSGTARFKLLDWVSNRNSWNNDLAISYVDAQTIRWSAASDYKLRLATTQDLIAVGYTHLNVTLTGDLGSAQIWYGEDDWSDGEICVSADSFVDGACTFEVDLTAFNADETFTMMANAASFADLLIKIEPVQKEIPKKVFSVTAPSGNDFIFEGAATVEENCDYSFTVIPFADSTTLTVSVNGVVLVPVSENTYLVENVSENLTISVEVQLFAPENVVLNTSNWTSASSINENGSLTTGANSQLTGSAMKQLWEEGYTHLVFTVNAEAASDNNTNYTHGGSWSQYWATFAAAADVDIRIDLNEFHNGDTWYNVSFNAGNMTVSNPRAYKSAETLNWTKSSTNCYLALEDGYYVLETRGNDFGVTSPASWVQKYMVSDDAGQRTWLMYTDYISQRDNTRSMLWGWGSAVNTVCGDVNGGWAWNNNVSADHNAFSLHLDKAGTARFKLLDWVSNRNSWNSSLAISYVDAQTIRWSAASDYKLRLATTQDLIAQGYSALKVTLTGNLGSAMVWYGEDDWSDGEICVSADSFVDGACTFEVDLTAFNAGENFTMMVSGAAFNDLLVKIEPMGKAEQYAVKLMDSNVCSLNGNSYAVAGQTYSFSLTTDANVTLETVTVNGVAYTPVDGIYTVPVEAVTGNLVIRVESIAISGAIVAADESYLETAKLLESELEAVSGSYGVYTLSDNVSYRSSILLGTNTIDANVAAETYSVSGNGTNIYIDGNCSRAVAYGAADFLRSLGYEFYTADVTTRPASISLNFSMAELTDTADFAVRSYLSAQTGYNENSLKNQAFTVMSKNNNALFANYDNFGGGVEIENFNGGVHNFNTFFVDQTEGKYGYTVSTGVGSETGFAPCLTNGVTYNVGGTDTTLTYAVARMKEAMLANPDAYYFSFCQNDGSTWYCGCDHCTADAASHNRSGTLVNFINAMIAQLEADPDLNGRDFRIITFAYSFTAQAPANVSGLSDKLQVWYAQWHNANYSINSDSQDLNNYTANLRTWADLTADGNLSLWLYDTHFGNYLAYFPSVNTIAANIAEAKALGVSNILVQGSWNAENMWQAEMKTYIWSKLLWDSSLNVETLQQDFLKAYFGEAAYSSVKTFVDLYDNGVGSSANVDAGYPISNGYGYFCHMDVYKQSTVHSKALDAAKAAVAAAPADSVYAKRANALLATVYGSVIGNWSGYEKWHDQWFCSDNFDDFEAYFGASAADCQAMLTTALENASITKVSERDMSVSEWIAYMTNLYNTAG